MNKRIRLLRKELKLSGEKFGERLGVTKTAISLIESGKNNVTEQMFNHICKEFNVNDEWLRYGTGGIKNMFTKKDDEILKNIERILNGENEFHKNLFKMLVQFDQEDLHAVEQLIDKFLQVKNQKVSAAVDVKEETPEQRIERQTQEYKNQLILEEKTTTSSASQDIKEKKA